MSLRDDLRSATLGQAPKFKSKIVEVEGLAVEVRAPSIREREAIIKSANIKPTADGKVADIDTGRTSAILVVALTYVPGTTEKVYEAGDVETLQEYPSGSWVDTLARECMQMLNFTVEAKAEIVKN